MTLERLTTINNAGISSSLVFTGIITAASFVGDGGGLTGVGGGTGEPTGDVDELFNFVSTAATVTANITFDTTNAGASSSYVLISQSEMHIETGIALTVGSGKSLVVNSLILPPI
jgi:hypothetical protein